MNRGVSARPPPADQILPEVLPSQEVHVWTMPVGVDVEKPLLEACASVLCNSERARSKRFRRQEDRCLFILSRTLRRVALSRYTGVDPAAWFFGENEFGRPQVNAPVEHVSIRFNLSHTEGMIALAIIRDRDVGIDVESLVNQSFNLGLARECLTSSELAAVLSRPGAQRLHAFLELWTLKEAYLKAIGLGHVVPATMLSFEIPDDGPPRVSFAPDLIDNPESWQFYRMEPSLDHVMAVAARADRDDLVLQNRAMEVDELYMAIQKV